jgi:lipopolysaccharide export system permease protein
MRLLDRYLFRELLAPLIYCLAFIESFIIFSTVFGDAGKIQEAKLHFLEAIEYAAAASTDSLTVVLPVALLMALLYALTHHSRHNEITAMRAAGISLWRICLPYFVVGIAASAALFGLNEYVVPRSTEWAHRLITRTTDVSLATGSKPLNFTNEREHRKWIISDYRAATGDMYGVQVDWTAPDGTGYILFADHALLTNGVWTFFDNIQEESKPKDEKTFMPMLRTNVLAMPEFDESEREIHAEIRVDNFLEMDGVHKSNVPLSDTFAYLKWHPDLSRSEKGRLLTQLQERVATPLTCLVVSLIAIPFGAMPGRRNLFFGVAGSIIICFIFFILQRVGMAFGAGGEWPPWLAAWLPNIFFSILGLILMARIR